MIIITIIIIITTITTVQWNTICKIVCQQFVLVLLHGIGQNKSINNVL